MHYTYCQFYPYQYFAQPAAVQEKLIVAIISVESVKYGIICINCFTSQLSLAHTITEFWWS